MHYKLKSSSGQIIQNSITYQEIAQEREELARLIKSLKTRKNRLDGIIKEYLQDHKELCVIGLSYQIQTVTKMKYPVMKILDYFDEYSPLSRDFLLNHAIIGKDDLEQMIGIIAQKFEKSLFTFKKITMTNLANLAEKTKEERLITKEIK